MAVVFFAGGRRLQFEQAGIGRVQGAMRLRPRDWPRAPSRSRTLEVVMGRLLLCGAAALFLGSGVMLAKALPSAARGRSEPMSDRVSAAPVSRVRWAIGALAMGQARVDGDRADPFDAGRFRPSDFGYEDSPLSRPADEVYDGRE